MLPQHETKAKGSFLALSRWLIYVVKFPPPRGKCPSTSLRPQKWPTMKMKNSWKSHSCLCSCAAFSRKLENKILLDSLRKREGKTWSFLEVFLSSFLWQSEKFLSSSEAIESMDRKNLRSHIFECHCVPQVKVPPPISQPPNWWIIGL